MPRAPASSVSRALLAVCGAYSPYSVLAARSSVRGGGSRRYRFTWQNCIVNSHTTLLNFHSRGAAPHLICKQKTKAKKRCLPKNEACQKNEAADPTPARSQRAGLSNRSKEHKRPFGWKMGAGSGAAILKRDRAASWWDQGMEGSHHHGCIGTGRRTARARSLARRHWQ